MTTSLRNPTMLLEQFTQDIQTVANEELISMMVSDHLGMAILDRHCRTEGAQRLDDRLTAMRAEAQRRGNADLSKRAWDRVLTSQGYDAEYGTYSEHQNIGDPTLFLYVADTGPYMAVVQATDEGHALVHARSIALGEGHKWLSVSASNIKLATDEEIAWHQANGGKVHYL